MEHKLAIPLLLLVAAVLIGTLFIGIKRYETFLSYTRDLGPLVMDASGNVVGRFATDASGNVVVPSASKGLVTLSLSDLITLFKASASSSSSSSAGTNTGTNAVNTNVAGTNAANTNNVNTGANNTNINGCSSDSSMQGTELLSAKATLIDSNEYIRKDSIPCYGCTLPQ